MLQLKKKANDDDINCKLSVIFGKKADYNEGSVFIFILNRFSISFILYKFNYNVLTPVLDEQMEESL